MFNVFVTVMILELMFHRFIFMSRESIILKCFFWKRKQHFSLMKWKETNAQIVKKLTSKVNSNTLIRFENLGADCCARDYLVSWWWFCKGVLWFLSLCVSVTSYHFWVFATNMERNSAACAMEWSIELEKALRSKKPGSSIDWLISVF